MRIDVILRGVALAIAVAGLIDPAPSLERPHVSPLTIAAIAPDAGDARSARGADAIDAAERLRLALDGAVDAQVRVVPPDQRAAACVPDVPCVVVAGDDVPRHLVGAGAILLGVVRTTPREASALRIAAVEAAPTQHPLAAGLVRVHLTGLNGPATIQVVDGESVVGTAGVKADGQAEATVDVPWWPVAAGPRRLTVRVGRAASSEVSATTTPPVEATLEAEVGVDVRAETADVVIYDTRPSWASTFVRRAIEADPRLRVHLRSRVAPGLTVSAGEPARLDVATLERASAVIVGGPDDLSADEVTLLDRFVRVKGGSLVLLPDRLPSGPVARLAPGHLRERLEPEPVALGPLRAGELLVGATGSSSARALVSTADGAGVVVVEPRGAGRVVLSGAMDAWRYRAENEADFDGFWRSLVAESAAAGGRALDVAPAAVLAAPGEDVRIEVTRRSMEQSAEMAVGVQVTCEGQAPASIRMWPSGRHRVAGVFTPAAPGACVLRASTGDDDAHEASGALIVTPRTHRDHQAVSRLDALAAAFGAVQVPAGDEATLAAAIEGRMAPEVTRAAVTPMRSPWWIAPFAACLAGEWWLRRRRGLR